MNRKRTRAQGSSLIEQTSMESKIMHRTSNPLVSVLRPQRISLALVGLVGLLSLVGLGACGGGGNEEPTGGAAAPMEPTAVTTRVASYRPLGAELAATATVEPVRRTMPGTKILGRVDRVQVHEGQKVAAGALLAKLESRDLEASVRQAEAAVSSAEAQLTNAKAQFERIQELEGKGSATRKNLEDATSGYQMAQAGLEQAKANLASAKVTLGYAEVRTPFAGWVVEKRIEEGDMVQPGAPLFTVEDLDPVKVVAEVPETEIAGLSPGDPATVEVTAVGFRGSGTIDRIVPSGDRRSRTFRVEVRQPNPDGQLKSGMFARVALQMAGSRPALLVPVSALVARGQLEGVFVAEPPKEAAGGGPNAVARLRWVRTGERHQQDGEDDIEILSGLSEGETYVVDPPTGLVDGNPLETVAAAADAAAPSGDGAEAATDGPATSPEVAR